MRVLVCGGRNFTDREWVFSVLDKLSPKVVIHGGAAGADSLASMWCVATRTTEMVFYAPWSQFGRSAGPRRNARMLSEGKPTLIVAFPGGPGTADMVRRARAAGIPTNQLTEQTRMV